MPLQNFVSKTGPAISAAWLNIVDAIKFTVFGDATTKAAARAALTSDAPFSIAEGGTGATSAAAARTSLGGVPVYSSGNFVGTMTGVTTAPTITIQYSVISGVVVLFIPFVSGTSNAVTATITGMPAGIRPATLTYWSSLITTTDNTVPGYDSFMEVGPSGVLVYSKNASGSGTWTAGGVKLIGGHMFTYLLV